MNRKRLLVLAGVGVATLAVVEFLTWCVGLGLILLLWLGEKDARRAALIDAGIQDANCRVCQAENSISQVEREIDPVVRRDQELNRVKRLDQALNLIKQLDQDGAPAESLSRAAAERDRVLEELRRSDVEKQRALEGLRRAVVERDRASTERDMLRAELAWRKQSWPARLRQEVRRRTGW
jgi:hypothetical protein